RRRRPARVGDRPQRLGEPVTCRDRVGLRVVEDLIPKGARTRVRADDLARDLDRARAALRDRDVAHAHADGDDDDHRTDTPDARVPVLVAHAAPTSGPLRPAPRRSTVRAFGSLASRLMRLRPPAL